MAPPQRAGQRGQIGCEIQGQHIAAQHNIFSGLTALTVTSSGAAAWLLCSILELFRKVPNRRPFSMNMRPPASDP